MKKNLKFGYEMLDGEVVLHPIESEIVKYIFEKHNEYCDHPPEDLVRVVIEGYRTEGEKITYEEAEKKVALDEIWQRIADEINEKWGNYLNGERLKKLNFPKVKLKSGLGQSAKNIISEDDWNRLKAFCDKGMEEKATGVQLTP